MPKAKPQDGTLKISPYAYKSGDTCYCLHLGDRPTKDTILLEAQQRETLDAAADSLREKFAAIVGMS